MTTITATAQATANRVLGLGTGMRSHAYVSRDACGRLIPALEALSVTVERECGTVSFVHGRYAAPWTRDTATGGGYDLTISWSRNAATGADNGIFVSGDCPQWRVNLVGQCAILALSRYSGNYGVRRLRELAASGYPEQAEAAEFALGMVAALAAARVRPHDPAIYAATAAASAAAASVTSR